MTTSLRLVAGCAPVPFPAQAAIKKGAAHEASHHRRPFPGRLSLSHAAYRCGTEPTLADYKAIEAGTPRSEALEKFGEPDSFLSGLFGDIYRCEDKLVIVYYDPDAYGSEDAPVLEVLITERQLPAGP